MEVKDLQRETIYTERVAELARAVLNLNEQLVAKNAELDAAKKDIADRDATIATLTGELAEMVKETANAD